MLPPRSSDDFRSVAERTLYREIERQLSDEYTVLHSVAWVAREGGNDQDGEADFLIAHPRYGVLLLEVKGGAIFRDGATSGWVSRDAGGEDHEIKDPFAQAQRNAYALRDKLEDDPRSAPFTWRIGRAVAFPEVIVADARLGPEAPRDLIVDSSDLTTIVRALHRAWGAASFAPGDDAIKALVTVLRPPVALSRPGLVGAMRAEHEEHLRLTKAQELVLEFVSGHRRVAIAGTAGSGKTLVAMEATRRRAREGFRVLYTCFTKALAASVRATLAKDLGPAMANVTVDNYHDLALRYAQEGGFSMPDGLEGDALNRFFQDILPQHLLDALDATPSRFDAIVVDEGQDFADIWWVTLEALLAGGDAGVLYVFYDEHQRIFDQVGGYPIPPPHHRLTRNCRTTRAIHRAAVRYVGGDACCDGPDGREPVEVSVADGQVVDSLRKVLHDLVTVEGVPLDDVVVLTPRSQRTSHLPDGARLGNRSLSWGEGGPNIVRCRTIQAFKGLESDVVILAEPERAHPSRVNALMHVALTRARHHVIVLGRLPDPPEVNPA